MSKCDHSGLSTLPHDCPSAAVSHDKRPAQDVTRAIAPQTKTQQNQRLAKLRQANSDWRRRTLYRQKPQWRRNTPLRSFALGRIMALRFNGASPFRHRHTSRSGREPNAVLARILL
jgi:hypothetical protein